MVPRGVLGPLAPTHPLRKSDFSERFVARFVARTDRSGECWLWQGRLNCKGYGQADLWCRRLRSTSSITVYAHRAAWILAYGKIPDGLFVCHHCDNPRCVRPDHLFTGTYLDNMRDAVAKGRRGVNHHGAKLTPEIVRVIRYDRANESSPTLAREFGVAAGTIQKVRRRWNWKHVP